MGNARCSWSSGIKCEGTVNHLVLKIDAGTPVAPPPSSLIRGGSEAMSGLFADMIANYEMMLFRQPGEEVKLSRGAWVRLW